MIPTRAYENGVYLAYANSAGYERGLNYLGQSLIAAPESKEVARAGPGSEVIHGTLPMETVPAAQSRLPYLKDRASLGTVILCFWPSGCFVQEAALVRFERMAALS